MYIYITIRIIYIIYVLYFDIEFFSKNVKYIRDRYVVYVKILILLNHMHINEEQ